MAGTDEKSPQAAARGYVADIAGLAGGGLLSYGAWSIYEPAGFIVGGVLLLALAVAIAGARS